MSYQLVPTADGSLSCMDLGVGQLCHNRAGAYTEAINNYVLPSGLLDRVQTTGQVRLLDACYGMGYNTWALINEMVDLRQRSKGWQSDWAVSVVAVEQSTEIMQFLPQILEVSCFDALKQNLEALEHNIYYRTLEDVFHSRALPAHFSMSVAAGGKVHIDFWRTDLRACLPQLTGPFDAVFHDPFSPQKMPELWSTDLFAQYARLLAPEHSLLLTYSTAAAVRGGLQAAGFEVLKTQGLGQKAGATLAIRNESQVAAFSHWAIPLEPWEQLYLQTRAAIPYRDAGLCQTREDILAQRMAEQSTSPRPSGASALKLKPRSSHAKAIQPPSRQS